MQVSGKQPYKDSHLLTNTAPQYIKKVYKSRKQIICSGRSEATGKKFLNKVCSCLLWAVPRGRPIKTIAVNLKTFQNLDIIWKRLLQYRICLSNMCMILPSSAQAPPKLGWVAIFSANSTTPTHPPGKVYFPALM